MKQSNSENHMELLFSLKLLDCLQRNQYCICHLKVNQESLMYNLNQTFLLEIMRTKNEFETLKILEKMLFGDITGFGPEWELVNIILLFELANCNQLKGCNILLFGKEDLIGSRILRRLTALMAEMTSSVKIADFSVSKQSEISREIKCTVTLTEVSEKNGSCLWSYCAMNTKNTAIFKE